MLRSTLAGIVAFAALSLGVRGQGPPLPPPDKWACQADVIVIGQEDHEHLAYCSAAGDINADGSDDLLFGGLQDLGEALKVRLFLGPSGTTSVSFTVPASPAGPDCFSPWGLSVAMLGDVNGGGEGDFAVGQPYYSSPGGGKEQWGRVWVVLGEELNLGESQQSIEEVATWFWTGSEAHVNFGLSVAAAGDYDGDGLADMIVGAPGDNCISLTYPGEAWIFLGTSAVNEHQAPLVFEDYVEVREGDFPGDRFGWSVGGRVGGTSGILGDIVVGAIQAMDDQAGLLSLSPRIVSGVRLNGYVRVYRYSEITARNGFQPPTESNPLAPAVALFGAAVASVGTLNDPAARDLVVGSPQYTQFAGTGGALRTGAIFAFDGSTGLSLNNDEPVFPESDLAPDDSFGWALADGGFMNADLRAEIVVGAPRLENLHPQGGGPCVDEGRLVLSGRVFVLDGATFASSTSNVIRRYAGETFRDRLGFSLAVGKVNADQWPDVVGGAVGYTIPAFFPEENEHGQGVVFFTPDPSP